MVAEPNEPEFIPVEVEPVRGRFTLYSFEALMGAALAKSRELKLGYVTKIELILPIDRIVPMFFKALSATYGPELANLVFIVAEPSLHGLLTVECEEGTIKVAQLFWKKEEGDS